MDSIEKELYLIQKKGLFRHLDLVLGCDFASNDYLGYSQNLKIHKKLISFLKSNFKLGSSGSRLVTGNSNHIEEVESFLSKCFKTENTLIFGSGYLANLGVCSAMGGSDTEFFSDELNHASIIDGIKLSKSKFKVFSHKNLNQLNNFLKKSKSPRKIIITESIFSMDGDLSPIQDLVKIADQYRAYLIIDEAHSTGTCGIKNLGVLTEIDFDPQKTIIIHTCGKALGAYGAFVCGTHALKKLLLNKARSQIFTTALSPFAVEHIRVSVSHLISDSQSVYQLKENIAYSKKVFEKYGLIHSGTHIIPIILGSNESVLKASDQFRKKGIFTKAIRSPAVPKGMERIRLTIQSKQNSNHLNFICQTLLEFKK